MARIKRGVPAHRRHKAILDRAKGFRLSKKLLFRPANEAVLHALAYAFRDRRRRKREMRALWIARINAASRQSGLPYNKLMRVASWQSHLLEHKSKKRKRNYENEQLVSKSDRKEVRRALGI